MLLVAHSHTLGKPMSKYCTCNVYDAFAFFSYTHIAHAVRAHAQHCIVWSLSACFLCSLLQLCLLKKKTIGQLGYKNLSSSRTWSMKQIISGCLPLHNHCMRAFVCKTNAADVYKNIQTAWMHSLHMAIGSVLFYLKFNWKQSGEKGEEERSRAFVFQSTNDAQCVSMFVFVVKRWKLLCSEN